MTTVYGRSLIKDAIEQVQSLNRSQRMRVHSQAVIDEAPRDYSMTDIINEISNASPNYFDDFIANLAKQIFNPAIKQDITKDGLMESMEYVQSLAARTGRKLSPDQVSQLAGIGEKNAINKAFFEMPIEEQSAPVIVDKMQDVASEIQKHFDSVVQARANERIKILEKDILALKINASSYLQHANNYLSDVGKKMIEIATMEAQKNKFDLAGMLAKILANPFYAYVSHSTYYSSITFKTNDVVLRYKDDNQGIDTTLNFGSFQVVWYYKDHRVRVSGNENNTNANGYLHPHLGSDVCWGNAKDAYLNAMATMDIPTVFNLLQAVLHQYNPDSPFVDIGRFIIAKHPERVSPQDITYAHNDTVFVLRDAIEHEIDYIDEMDTEDGRAIQIRVYRKYHARFGLQLSNENYYRTRNNKYVLIKDGAIV